MVQKSGRYGGVILSKNFTVRPYRIVPLIGRITENITIILLAPADISYTCARPLDAWFQIFVCLGDYRRSESHV